MIIQFYAGLKDYFPSQLDTVQDFTSIEELKSFLIQQNPAAAKLLSASRFAAGSDILTSEIPTSHDIVIAILPPSSGG